MGVWIFLVVASISGSTGTLSESQIASFPAERINLAEVGDYSYAGDVRGTRAPPHDAPLQSHGRLLSELAAENPVLSLLGLLGSLFTWLTICQVRTPYGPPIPPTPPIPPYPSSPLP